MKMRNNTTIVAVEHVGVLVVLFGTYYKGFIGTYEDPPTPPEFDIQKVMIEGVDVTELIEYFFEGVGELEKDNFFEELELLAIDKLQEEIRL